MGLDMYLNRKIWIGGQYEHRQVSGEVKIKQGQNELWYPAKKISEIVEQVGYWRKANAIHEWFVDNVQDGKDDCKEYWVSNDDLEKLLSICKTIKEKCPLVAGKVANGQRFNKKTEEWEDIIEDGEVMTNSEIAAELLPTQSGFFFGGTNYDQYYYYDILNTIEIIENIFKENDELEKQGFNGEIYYRASW